MSQHRETPDQTLTRMPGGIPFIIGNELAERFSFYGMKGILVIFMTQHLLNASGETAYMSDEKAKGVYHLFTGAAYFFPILGAIIADVILGKYRTILWLSLMYCLGHGCLAIMDVNIGGHGLGMGMTLWLYLGMAFIAMGAGAIKPCVSAHVGDQFGTGNKHLLTQVFNWFYFSINLGAASSMILTPILLEKVGPWAAFGLPGVLMAIATFVFWLGRNRFIHVPPSGWKKFQQETFSPEGKRALLNLAPLFLIFVPMFWAMFDQTGSAWVLQGDKMNRDLGFVWLPSQIQAVNPVFILLGIPVFTYLVYPFMGKFFEPTPLRKIGIGLTLTGVAFAVSALIEQDIENRQSQIAVTIVGDLSTDAAAFEYTTDEEELPGQIDAWKRAVSSLDMAGMSPEVKSELIGMEPAAFEALMSDKEARLPMEAVATMLAHLDDPAYTSSPKVLNAAVMAARAAPEESGWDEARIVGYLETMPNIIWQFLAYFILTSAEIMVSIVCLEFAYTQSPRRMKSFIMGVYFLGVSLGNFFVSGLNFVLDSFKGEDGTTALEGATYYWFFTALMGLTVVAYIVFAKTYKGQTFIQGEEEQSALEAESEAEAPDAR